MSSLTEVGQWTNCLGIGIEVLIPNQALYFSLSIDYRMYCFVQHPRTLQIWPQHPPPASPPSTISSQTYLPLASAATGVYPMWPQGGN